jgi:hypothetical protein
MSVQGNPVLASDFNYVRNLGIDLINNGFNASFGYGQIIKSGAGLSTGSIVTPGYLNGLRNDLFNTRAHQIGTAPALAETAVTGNIITATDVATFRNYADLCSQNRDTADPSRLTTTTLFTQSRTSSWRSQVSSRFDIVSNINYNVTGLTPPFGYGEIWGPLALKWFFNAGGQVRMNFSRTGGSATAQNTSWSNLLSGAGTVTFGATLARAAEALDGGFLNIFSSTATAPYATNELRIRASTLNQNLSTSQGTLRAAYAYIFEIFWLDPYVDPSPGNPPAPDDLVDGTLSYTVSLVYPVGGAALAGGGNWIGFGVNGVGPGGQSYHRLPSQVNYSITGS